MTNAIQKSAETGIVKSYALLTALEKNAFRMRKKKNLASARTYALAALSVRQNARSKL